MEKLVIMILSFIGFYFTMHFIIKIISVFEFEPIKVDAKSKTFDLPRPLCQLLQTMLTEVQANPLKYSGMCEVRRHLYNTGVITMNEDNMLYNHLQYNKPRNCDPYFGYWWKEGDWTPRIKWLKKQINKTKKY